MADNLTTQSATPATVPASSVIATDDVGGVHFQKVKIDVGADGASAPLSNSNPVPVSDAGGSLTVDAVSLPLPTGAATSANQDAANILLAAIETALEILDNAISGNEVQADILSIAAGTNTIGATRDAGPSWTSAFGVSGAAVVSADMTTAAAVTDAPTSGQKIVITDIVLSADTAMNVLLEEETSGTDIWKVFIPANGTVQITPRGKVKLATVDKKLTAKASVAGNIAVTAHYYSEA